MVSLQITGKGKQQQCVLELNGNSFKYSTVFRGGCSMGGRGREEREREK